MSASRSVAPSPQSMKGLGEMLDAPPCSTMELGAYPCGNEIVSPPCCNGGGEHSSTGDDGDGDGDSRHGTAARGGVTPGRQGGVAAPA